MKKLIAFIIIGVCLMLLPREAVTDLPTTPIPEIPTSVKALPVPIKVMAFNFADKDAVFLRYKNYKIAERVMETPYDPADPAGLTVSDWYLENCVLLFLLEASYEKKVTALVAMGIPLVNVDMQQGKDLKPIIMSELATRRGIMLAYIEAQ